MTRVLVVGVPRSGTTWVAQALCAGAGASYVEEPDNHFRFAYAYRAKRELGRGPYPEARVDEDLDETAFGVLWRHAFTTGRRTALQALSRSVANRLVTLAGPKDAAHTLAGTIRDARLLVASRLAMPEHAKRPSQHMVVKSVYAPLCAEWVSARHAARTVVVVRRPLEIVASWVTLGWLGPRWPDPLSSVPAQVIEALTGRCAAPAAPSSRLGRAAWLVGVLQRTLEQTVERNPSWALAAHELLYRSPLDEFRWLADVVGLPWSDAGDRAIDRGRRPGSGYDTRRVASQLDDAWRGRLSEEEVREIRDVLEPLSAWD